MSENQEPVAAAAFDPARGKASRQGRLTPSKEAPFAWQAKAALRAIIRGERVTVYGGLIAENWTQATARDVLAAAWLRCSDAGFIPVLSVHDELVFELPETTAHADLARIIALMETPVPWAPHLPLRVEGKLMSFYTK